MLWPSFAYSDHNLLCVLETASGAAVTPRQCRRDARVCVSTPPDCGRHGGLRAPGGAPGAEPALQCSPVPADGAGGGAPRAPAKAGELRAPQCRPAQFHPEPAEGAQPRRTARPQRGGLHTDYRGKQSA